MSARWLAPGEELPTGSVSEVICLLCDGDSAYESLQGLLTHTPGHVPIVLFGPDADGLARLADVFPGRDLWLLHPEGAMLSAVARATAPADPVLVSRGSRVGTGWLARLAAAARSDSTVVTATALADHGGALSVEVREPDRIESLARRALGNYPRIMRARGHCVFVRRRALELVGELDGFEVAGFEAELGAFSLRCLEHGMVHVAADDVLVRCDPPSEPADVEGFEREDYEDERGTLRRAVRVADVVINEKLSVTLDARALGPLIGGTQVYIAELALALAGSGQAAVRLVIAPDDVAPELEPLLSSERGFEVITYETAVSGVPLTHVVHRPQQVFSEPDMALLRLLGERVVVTHQDLIAFRNPAYHAGLDEWRQYRRITRIALAVADMVVSFSEHARQDLISEGLVDARHTAVVGIGSQPLWRPPVRPRRPEGVPVDAEFMLCLGADYMHKNRPFAIRMVGELRAAHGWAGQLVLAGPHVTHGSSRDEERLLLADDSNRESTVLDAGPVDEAGKAWLYEHAIAVLFPSLYEGFGLIPYEAARAGVPCLFAPQTALLEIGSASLATLIPWDVASSAAATAPLLSEGAERREHVERLRRAADGSRWDVVTPRILAAYEAAIRADQRAGAHHAWEELERERYIRDLADQVQMYRDAVAGDAVMLVKPDGWLDEPTRRGLMRVASRPAVRKVSLWPFALLGRMWKDRARDDQAKSVSEPRP